jgi:transcriptional regulator with XRE-family HTH domain
MSVADKLRQRRLELQLTRSELAARIRVTPSAIANYENGISTPKPDILISLINALGVDANYIYSDYLPSNQVGQIYEKPLSMEEADSIRKYKALTEEGKRLIRVLVNEEYTRLMAQGWITVPCYLPGVRKLHAGFLMQPETRPVRIRKADLPKGTDFCFQIQLDRYQPVFQKFDILALQKTQAVHNEMGIFCLNGVYYIRTLFQTSEARWLRALNVIEPDILIRAEDELHCLGKILGRVDGLLEESDEAVQTD